MAYARSGESETPKKTTPGWRVKVRNVIKVVSTNRKPTRIKSEVISLKSPRFYVSEAIQLQVLTENNVGGCTMMLESAQQQFGITPKRKTFRGQKLLVYTLPNEQNLLEIHKVPVEKLVRNEVQKTEIEPDQLDVKKMEEAAKSESNLAKEVVSKQEAAIPGLPDGKTVTQVPPDGRPKPDKEVEGTPSEKEPSLFSQPMMRDELPPPQRMYFGPRPLNFTS